MQAAGIVAEYNPFHLGHLYHLERTKDLTGLPVIAVISGTIMQRGELAFLDKWTRARLTVENGVDLVLELPAAFSLRSAQYFAQGAVAILQATGLVTHLVCGAEDANRNFAGEASYLAEHQEELRALLQQGHSYARATSLLLQQAFGRGLDTPNDILALEYTKALLHYGSSIRPHYVQRLEANYNDTTISGSIASATAIRRNYQQEQALAASGTAITATTSTSYSTPAFPEQSANATDIQPGYNRASYLDAVPANVAQELQRRKAGIDSALLWQLCRYKLALSTPQDIAASCQVSEGLEQLLKQGAACNSLQELESLCSKKRYPASRIRRLLLQLLLNQPASVFDQREPAYLRPLAFNDTGRSLLRQLKDRATLPLLTNPGAKDLVHPGTAYRQQLQLEIAASSLYALLTHSPQLNPDLKQAPIYVR